MPIRSVCEHLWFPELTNLRRNISHNCLFIANLISLNITHMVCHNINDYFHTIFLSLCTHRSKFCLISKPCITIITNAKCNRLVEFPPVSILAACSIRNTDIAIGNTFPVIVLRLLYRRSLNSCISCCCNIFHILLDIVVRPVPAVKNNSLLRALCQTIICSLCCIDYFARLILKRNKTRKRCRSCNCSSKCKSR